MSCEMNDRICGDSSALKMGVPDSVNARASLKGQILTHAAKADAYADGVLGPRSSVSSEPAVIHHYHESLWYPWSWGRRETVVITERPSCTSRKKEREYDEKDKAALLFAVAAVAAGCLAYAIGSSTQSFISAKEDLMDAAKFKQTAETYERLSSTPEEQAYASAALKAAELNERLAGRLKKFHLIDLAINVPLMVGTLSIMAGATCTSELAKSTIFQSIHHWSCSAKDLIVPYASPMLVAGIVLLGAKLVKWGYDYNGKSRDAQALRNCVTLLTTPHFNETIRL